MSETKIGFAVLYRWRLKSGSEERFQQGWEAVTIALMRERRALGSRLHRAEDGTFYAYAQWPHREVWEASQAAGSIDDVASTLMREAIAESFPAVPLEPIADYLQPAH